MYSVTQRSDVENAAGIFVDQMMSLVIILITVSVLIFIAVMLGACIIIPLVKLAADSIYPFFIANTAMGMNLHFEWYLYVGVFLGILAVYLIISTILTHKIKKIVPVDHRPSVTAAVASQVHRTGPSAASVPHSFPAPRSLHDPEQGYGHSSSR